MDAKKVENYYASNKDNEKVFFIGKHLYIEYNPHIKMYRINSDIVQLPNELLGYSPHKKAQVRMLTNFYLRVRDELRATENGG